MTRIADLLAAGPTLSFEFFPPKTDEAERQLEKTIHELATLQPSFVSVTYGAGGSTRERTRDIVVQVNRQQSFPAMAHLTCVGHTRAQIEALLDEYQQSGVCNILALAGDPPADGTDPGGDFRYATDLVELVRSHPGAFSIGVAAHPELHPRSDGDRAHDRRYLAAKLEVADFGITQFFFRAEDYVQMADELSDLGSTRPVLPGIMPAVNVAGLVRMAKMNQALIPPALLERLEAAADDPDEVRRIGIDVSTELGQALLDAGAPGLHLYALNRSESVRQIVANLGLTPPAD
ncbi:MAG TPA: methylenetetrahydrofolate reductase [Acidimicrobiales bacterium]|jgi:methylenetetrahydrofolate reductase (NADPH)|nr:methylenetetrahydrofolate reductase [Acidimicrobiales bacterium]